MTYAQNTVIVTGTLYDVNNKSGKVRSNLGLQAIAKAKEIGYDILIMDAGSNGNFLEKAENLGAIVKECRGQTMGGQRRLALEEALKLNKQVLAWTDLEKEDYVPSIYRTVLPILSKNVDSVIPKRQSMISYPREQLHSEKFANLFWEQVTGTDLDITFGPRTFNREAAQYYLDYKGEYGDKWDFLYIPVINQIVDGKRIKSVDIDYIHPKEQTELETGDLEFFKKRDFQIHVLMDCVAPHWKKLHENVK